MRHVHWFSLVASVIGIVVSRPLVAGERAVEGEDPFAVIAPLIGEWQGTAQGEPGTGTARRSYARALGDRFIHVRNESTYPPQEKNPKGEKHQDEGFISFDRSRKTLVFRQFHTEGFVNQYVQQPGSPPQRIVFESESIENIPAGWRARETYLITGADTFSETFELAEPGKEFMIYSRSRFTRVR
ncbi:MAG: hypothetical protein U0Q12_10120 [Vicinamibacterales bacterium]